MSAGTELETRKNNGANVARCHPPLPARKERDAISTAEIKEETHKNEEKEEEIISVEEKQRKKRQ